MVTLAGPDVSRHQGTVDWSRVAAAHDFAIIKATEGTSYNYTGWFTRNWQQLRATHLVPGAYHFLRTSSGKAQAAYYVSVVGNFDKALAVLDVETAANGTKPGIGVVREFAAEFKRLVPGHPLLVYTGRWYWVGEIGNPRGVDIGPLWHSEYDTGREVDDGPELDNYGGWPGATIWQWTSSGRCPGVDGNCDLNIFYGDRRDLLRLTGSSLPAPPEPLTGVPDMAFTYGSPDRPVYFCDGGKSVGLNERTDLEAIRQAFTAADQKLPHLNLDSDTFNAFRKSFPGE